MRVERVTTLMQKAAESLVEIKRARKPILITRRGMPSAYLVDAESYEFMQQRIGLLEGIVRGEQAVAQGRTISHAQAKTRLSKWLR